MEEFILPKIKITDDTKCDFCSSFRSQKYKFDVCVDKESVRELRVCSNLSCDESFQKSRLKFFELENRVPFELLASKVPSFLDPKKTWKVLRGNGDVEEGWKIARNWRVSTELGCLYTIRSEPWYRIPLLNGDKIKLTLLSELRFYNSESFPEDIWDMIFMDVLPPKHEQPSDVFMQYYPAKLWNLQEVFDEKLKEMRLDVS